GVLGRDDLRAVEVEADLRQAGRQRDRLVDLRDAVRERGLVVDARCGDRDRRRLGVRAHAARERAGLRLLRAVHGVDPRARRDRPAARATAQRFGEREAVPLDRVAERDVARPRDRVGAQLTLQTRVQAGEVEVEQAIVLADELGLAGEWLRGGIERV